MVRHWHYRVHFILAIVVPLAIYLPLAVAAASSADQWVNHGGGLDNWRSAKIERTISVHTAQRLALKWEFDAGGGISATPAIYKGVLYFPTWNGSVYAVDQDTGSLLWSTNLTQATGILSGPGYRTLIGSNAFTRATPVVAHNTVLVGIAGPAYLVALDRHTGRVLWTNLVDEHPWAILTQSGTAHERSYYFGVASLEEAAPLDVANYNCCTFIGSFQKLDIRTGKVVWKTSLLPDNGGKPGLYSGAAVWGSSPAIDLARGLVYITTGNVYDTPPAIVECLREEQNRSKPEVPDPCVEPGNHENSILALELASGHIRWSRSVGGFDAWNAACLLPGGNPNCPAGPALDYDFGEAPMLLTIPVKSSWVDVAVAGQKSGIVWALDRDTGDLVWDTVSGPGGVGGGAMWGASTDGKYVYTNNANSDNLNYTLLPSNKTTKGGAWVGLDAATGSILWTTPTPNNALAVGPVSVANGVVFGTSSYQTGRIFALNGRTGDVLWHYDSIYGGSQGGISVSKGCAFVGSGYPLLGVPGTTLYAFCVK